ncbi:MAG: NUDIX hydrolase [Planctomycetes bacterium]|nr:NUDIX hydrolase [Planctomycetota bacterium]
MTPTTNRSDASDAGEDATHEARSPSGPRIARVEVLRDEAATRGATDGFLHLQRLVVQNVYEDGSTSNAYPCDIVSRRCVDAVTVVLFDQKDGRVRVGLRENLRVPVWLRRQSDKVLFADDPRLDTMLETVAGVIEPEDRSTDVRTALRTRAAAEAREEVGIEVAPTAIHDLGGASFPSPGITDEKVFFAAAQVDLDAAKPAHGDGSVMEEVGGLVILDLTEAITRCRDGRIADMKTEIALLRLRDRLDAGLA